MCSILGLLLLYLGELSWPSSPHRLCNFILFFLLFISSSSSSLNCNFIYRFRLQQYGGHYKKNSITLICMTSFSFFPYCFSSLVLYIRIYFVWIIIFPCFCLPSILGCVSYGRGGFSSLYIVT